MFIRTQQKGKGMNDFQSIFDTPLDIHGIWSYKWDYRKEKTGEADIQPLWIADMDFEAPQAVKNAIFRRAQLGIYGYTAVDAEYHEAVIDWQKTRHNWEIREEWLVHTPSVICAIQTAVRALTEPEDFVLIQPPVYHPFFQLIQHTHRRVLENPLLDCGDHYEIDWDDFEYKLRTYRPKIFLLCNPHNPVGKVYTPDELRRFGELSRKYGALVVSDEIHGDLVRPNMTHVPFASLGEEFAQNSIVCTAPSKTFNLAGLCLSNIIIPNPKIRKAVQRTLTEAGFPSPNLFALTAANAAFREGAAWLDALRDYLAGNRAFAEDCIADCLRPLRAYRADGTYFLWLDCRALGLRPEQLKQFLLHEAGIWVNQGYTFGKQGAGFVRINLALPRVQLQSALEHLAQAVERLSANSLHQS